MKFLKSSLKPSANFVFQTCFEVQKQNAVSFCVRNKKKMYFRIQNYNSSHFKFNMCN